MMAEQTAMPTQLTPIQPRVIRWSDGPDRLKPWIVECGCKRGQEPYSEQKLMCTVCGCTAVGE